ncbi:hypothetical protein GCM10009856_04860 [Mycolicibacterium llatzerense]
MGVDPGEFGVVLADEIRQAEQDVAAPIGRVRHPPPLSLRGYVNRSVDFSGSSHLDDGVHATGTGIDVVVQSAGGARDPVFTQKQCTTG